MATRQRAQLANGPPIASNQFDISMFSEGGEYITMSDAKLRHIGVGKSPLPEIGIQH
jgi:hypothetical protein